MTIGLAAIMRGMAALGALLVLSSCYIPDKFRAELRLSRYGDYAISYEGDLIWAPILHEYGKGTITAANEKERIDHIHADLKRDPAVKEARSLGKGRFHVRYERAGRLGKNQLTSLVRRDARLISMKSNPNNVIVVVANSVKPADGQRMAASGVGMEGEFRVTTDANVVEHNASSVRQFGAFKVYVWAIENPLSPPPRLVMIRDFDPSRPLPDKAKP